MENAQNLMADQQTHFTVLAPQDHMDCEEATPSAARLWLCSFLRTLALSRWGCSAQAAGFPLVQAFQGSVLVACAGCLLGKRGNSVECDLDVNTF